MIDLVAQNLQAGMARPEIVQQEHLPRRQWCNDIGPVATNKRNGIDIFEQWQGARHGGLNHHPVILLLLLCGIRTTSIRRLVTFHRQD